MKVAIIGTVGLPANYGGFETLVEQLVLHNNNDTLQYEVYCSAKAYASTPSEFHGAILKYLPLKANGLQSIPYDIISMIKASISADVLLILGVSGCIFLPIFRLFSSKKIIVNIDGLEHRRQKWSKWVRKFLKLSEKIAVRYADVIITDNKCITDYVKAEYGKPSRMIAYGGDHVLQEGDNKSSYEILQAMNIDPEAYSLSICRIEPENNVHIILEAFEKTANKLVAVGNWTSSSYGRELMEKYKDSQYVRITPAIYDLKTLDVLRKNCTYYLHGHSAGGTNPSLVEAMFYEKPILAFDCNYNRETTKNKAIYFNSTDDLASLLTKKYAGLMEIGVSLKKVAEQEYRWKVIANEYENLFNLS
ncbi:MAG: DUF1972 domain-containing protein [Muribaculaceae bacterium]|nr:DUF1972 domain-containing protein [Muribaculaceae bacterium]